MRKGIKLAAVAAVSAATFAVLSDASMAWPSTRHRHYYPAWPPTIRLYRSNPGTNYYNVCGYGDCACLRARAVASGGQVWWDRYQACAG